MKKTDFVDQFAQKTDQTKKVANETVDQFIDLIKEALKSGDEVVFPELGKFQLTKRAARTGINPKTMEKIKIAARVVPTFKASKKFKTDCAS